MNHSSDTSASLARGPRLALVGAPATPAVEGAPRAWREALGAVLGWLGVEAPAGFAPWQGWSPQAFQDGGDPALPAARFVAGYCIDHAAGARRAHADGVDVMLISPHPAAQEADEALLRAMLVAAAAEGRRRVAIIVHARQKEALAALRLDEHGAAPAILAIEEALPALMRPQPAFDAVIAMPQLRGIVAGLLAEATGVRGPWPMLWQAGAGAQVACECPRGVSGLLPLDAQALVLALALALRAGGEVQAARRLHEGWARLRDSGVGTATRGSDSPYASEVGEAAFIALLCGGAGARGRSQKAWHALENQHKVNFRAPMPHLRIVSSNLVKS